MSKRLDFQNLSEDEKAWLIGNGRGGEIPDDQRESVQDSDYDDDSANEGYDDWKVADLKEEIVDRNADRDEELAIEPESNRRADLVAALVEDDSLTE